MLYEVITGQGPAGYLVGVAFPAVALEILRAATRPDLLPDLVYGAETVDPEVALARNNFV